MMHYIKLVKLEVYRVFDYLIMQTKLISQLPTYVPEYVLRSMVA